MQVSHDRVATHPRYRHNDLAHVLSHVVPSSSGKLETVALGFLVCTFWGLVLYAALAFGLH